MSASAEYLAIREKFASVEHPCEVCGTTRFEVLQHRGRIGKAGEYGPLRIAICDHCGFTFQNPRPEPAFYEEYYRHLYRELSFGSAKPSQEYVDLQRVRGSNVLSYISSHMASPGRLLDHGCASGATMLPFRDAGWTVTGIDPHVPSVETGVSEFGLDIHVAGGEALPFAENSFDVVISLGSLEHVYDFERSMAELERVMAPGGLLLIRWRGDTLFGSPYEYYNHNHYRFFTPRTWTLALSRYGFAVVDMTNREIEGNTGAAYTLARHNGPNGLIAVETLIAQGICDDASVRLATLSAYKLAFRDRCTRFLALANRLGRDPLKVKSALDAKEIEYRLLMGDPSWTVPRAILEAERYAAEVALDPLVSAA